MVISRIGQRRYPRLLAEHELGYEVVYAQRTRRKKGIGLRVSYFLDSSMEHDTDGYRCRPYRSERPVEVRTTSLVVPVSVVLLEEPSGP
jgi:hypothetical protein